MPVIRQGNTVQNKFKSVKTYSGTSREDEELAARIQSTHKAREVMEMLSINEAEAKDKKHFREQIESMLKAFYSRLDSSSIENRKKNPFTNRNRFNNFKKLSMPYGKHEGRRIGEIVEEEPGYLDWLCGADDEFRVRLNLFMRVVNGIDAFQGDEE